MDVTNMYYGLILTLITGLSFLIGIIILKNVKNKAQFSLFTISLAFIVMLGLIVFDILPELVESNNWYLLIPFIIGFGILIVLDKFIPHHHHEHDEKHCDKKDHALHLNHIGVITILALALHNMIEGLTLYSLTLGNVKSGILMAISISLHNIPLGFQIGNSLRSQKRSFSLILLLVLSSVLGALFVILYGDISLTIEYVLLSLTLGMLLYIVLFEFLQEICRSAQDKEVIYGLVVGVLVLIITFLI